LFSKKYCSEIYAYNRRTSEGGKKYIICNSGDDISSISKSLYGSREDIINDLNEDSSQIDNVGREDDSAVLDTHEQEEYLSSIETYNMDNSSSCLEEIKDSNNPDNSFSNCEEGIQNNSPEINDKTSKKRLRKAEESDDEDYQENNCIKKRLVYRNRYIFCYKQF